MVLICAIITITNGVNFFLLLIPILFIIVLLWFSRLLKQRFGKTYGAAFLLFLICVVPIGWFIFSANLPMTYLMMEDRKKHEDLLSFKNYSGGVDAKKEVAEYQLRKDSVLREEVSQLLKEDNIDSVLSLIRKNQLVTEKIKKGLFSGDSLQKIKAVQKINVDPVSNSLSGATSTCGNYLESSNRYLTVNDIIGKPSYTLRLMRNEIYMRHNYIFTSQDLLSYAYSFDCYQALNANVDNMLTNIEKTNIQLIQQYEVENESTIPNKLSSLIPIVFPVPTAIVEQVSKLWNSYKKESDVEKGHRKDL